MRKKFFKKPTFNTLWFKFFCCYTFPILFIVLIWITRTTIASEKSLLDTLLNYRCSLNEQLITTLDSNGKDLYTQSYFLYDEIENLKTIFEGPSATDYFESREKFTHALNNYLRIAKQLDGLLLLDLNGNTIFIHDKYDSYYTNYNASEESWFLHTLESTNIYASTQITALHNMGGSPTVVTSGKLLYDIQKKEPFGIALGFSYIDNFVQCLHETTLTDGEQLLLLDANKQIVYSTFDETMEYNVLETHENFDTLSTPTGTMLRTTAESSVFGWTLIAFTPYNTNFSAEQILKGNNLLPFLVIILISLAVSSMISLSVTKPLAKLTASLKKLETGDFNAKLSIKGSDELAQIGNAYNKMLTKIQLLIKEKFELKLSKTQSELEALQSQINPHFLFNTLNSIKAVAYDGNIQKTTQMVQALSDLMHYTLSRGEYLVSFSDELNLINKYLYLQKYRFEDRFSVEYDIEDSVLTLEIPRLILQPLVENAIKHGLEHLKNNGKLIVTAKVIDNKLHIYVANNGIKIPEQQLRDLNYSLTRLPEISVLEYQKIGLLNVCYRLHLHYPEEFVMKISSTENFTTIKLVLPAKFFSTETTLIRRTTNE